MLWPTLSFRVGPSSPKHRAQVLQTWTSHLTGSVPVTHQRFHKSKAWAWRGEATIQSKFLTCCMAIIPELNPKALADISNPSQSAFHLAWIVPSRQRGYIDRLLRSFIDVHYLLVESFKVGYRRPLLVIVGNEIILTYAAYQRGP